MTGVNSFERVVDAFRSAGLNVKDRDRDQVVAQGPGHGPTDLSVLITYNGDQTLIYSYANDDLVNILEGVGLQTRDLFDNPRGVEYRYGDGRVVQRTVDKKFFQAGNKTGNQLFRTEFDPSKPVLFVGGEKDVRTLEHFGHQATTSPGGEGNVGNYDLTPLHGLDVVVIRDLDDTGKKFADVLVEKLGGKARTLRVATAAVGKDASDHIAAGRAITELETDYAFDSKIAIKDAVAKLEKLKDAPIRHIANMLTDLGARYTPDDSDSSEMSLKAFGELTEDWWDWLLSEDADLDVIPGPWEDLNEPLARGFHKGRLYLFAARPGRGKSLALTNFALMAANQGYKGALFSIEMGSIEVMSRVIAAGTNAKYGDITKRNLERLTTDKSIERIATWLEQRPDLPLWISEKETLPMARMIAECRKIKEQYGLDFIIVDYLQLIQPERAGMSENEALTKISRALKVLAKELDCAVIAAAQLNREAAKDAVPKISDLRSSGAMEQDADVVVLMHHEGDNDNPTGEVQMILGKNRTGPTMSIALEWRPHQAKIGHWGEFDGERPRREINAAGDFTPQWASQQ